MSAKRSHMQTRKELLLARASIERIELAAHVSRIKAKASPSALLRSVLPIGRGGEGGGKALPAMALQVWQFLRRYPVVSSAASMALARIPFRGVFKLVKLGGFGAALYQGYKLWSAMKSDPHEKAMRAERRAARRAAP